MESLTRSSAAPSVLPPSPGNTARQFKEKGTREEYEEEEEVGRLSFAGMHISHTSHPGKFTKKFNK